MKYEQAKQQHAQQIYDLVQESIHAIYPKYYPEEVVTFFSNHHRIKRIEEDIAKGSVYMLLDEEQLIATGSYDQHHLTRVFVKPEQQGKGYGTYVIQQLEELIAQKHAVVQLDASLPASQLYEHLGYHSVRHEQVVVENQRVLVYEVMEKEVVPKHKKPMYDGKQFVPLMNSKTGEVNEETVFTYHQKGTLLWAEYHGGDILFGQLLGVVQEHEELFFYYQHVNQKQECRIGECHSVPVILEDGRIQLHETWNWLNHDTSSGTSILIEKK